MVLDYLDYYGLSRDPFESKLFVAVAGRGALLDQTIQLLCYSNLIPVIQGPIGSGRSTLLQAVAAQMPSDRVLYHLPCDQFLLQDSSLMTALADLFDLQGYAHAPKAVLSFIQEQQHLVLMVDDYDLLDASSQQALLALVEQGLKLVLTVIDAQGLQYSGYEVMPLPLQPMNAQEALSYLNQHFVRAGLQQGVPLEAKLIGRFNQLAQGWPSKLNALVAQHLRFQAKRPAKTGFSLASVPKGHALAVALILMLVAASFWWQFQREFQATPEPLADNAQTLDALEADVDADAADRVRSSILDAIAEQQLMVEQQQSGIDEPLGLAEPSGDDRAEPAPAPLVQPLPAATEVVSLRDRLAAQQASATPLPATTRPSVTPAARALSPIANATASGAATSTTLTNANPASASVAPLPGFPWLAAVRANEYSLQLFGSWELDQASAFQRGLTLSEPSAVAVTLRDGRRWYVVLAGQYGTQQQAQQALSRLPATLREQGAWARTFRSLGLP